MHRSPPRRPRGSETPRPRRVSPPPSPPPPVEAANQLQAVLEGEALHGHAVRRAVLSDGSVAYTQGGQVEEGRSCLQGDDLPGQFIPVRRLAIQTVLQMLISPADLSESPPPRLRRHGARRGSTPPTPSTAPALLLRALQYSRAGIDGPTDETGADDGVLLHLQIPLTFGPADLSEDLPHQIERPAITITFLRSVPMRGGPVDLSDRRTLTSAPCVPLTAVTHVLTIRPDWGLWEPIVEARGRVGIDCSFAAPSTRITPAARHAALPTLDIRPAAQPVRADAHLRTSGSASPPHLEITLPPSHPLVTALINLGPATAECVDDQPGPRPRRLRMERIDGYYQQMIDGAQPAAPSALIPAPGSATAAARHGDADVAPSSVSAPATRRGRPSMRKQLGAWYTPRLLQTLAVESSVVPLLSGTSDTDARPASPMSPPLRVLDPACGSGRLLTAALMRMASDPSQTESSSVPEEPEDPATSTSSDTLIPALRGMYGIDIDPIAVSLCRIALLNCCFDLADPRPGRSQEERSCRRAVTQQIVRRHALLDPLPADWIAGESSDTAMGDPHWRSQTNEPQFDVVIANPPYVDSEAGALLAPDERAAIAQQYAQTAVGNWDLFIPFLERGARLTRPGGYLAMVLPIRALAADYAAAVQRWLLREGDLTIIHDCTLLINDFENAAVSTVVLGWRRAEEAPRQTARPRIRFVKRWPPPQSGQREVEVRADLLQALPDGYIAYPCARIGEQHDVEMKEGLSSREAPSFTSSTSSSLPSEIERELDWVARAVRLGEVACLSDGATTAEAYRIREHVIDRSDIAPVGEDDGAPETGDWLRLVNTGAIDPHVLLWGLQPMRYLGFQGRSPVVPRAALEAIAPRRLAQARHPDKVIVAGLAQRIEAAVAPAGVLCGKSAVLIRLNTGDGESVHVRAPTRQAPSSGMRMPPPRVSRMPNICPYALAALLNTADMNRMYRRLFGYRGPDGRAMCIGPRQLALLPIPNPSVLAPAGDDPGHPSLMDAPPAPGQLSRLGRAAAALARAVAVAGARGGIEDGGDAVAAFARVQAEIDRVVAIHLTEAMTRC